MLNAKVPFRRWKFPGRQNGVIRTISDLVLGEFRDVIITPGTAVFGIVEKCPDLLPVVNDDVADVGARLTLHNPIDAVVHRAMGEIVLSISVAALRNRPVCTARRRGNGSQERHQSSQDRRN